MKIEFIGHASIKLINNNKVFYFDPYKIKEQIKDADYIFITHDHYDHYDEDSIKNIKKNDTKIIVPKCLKNKDHTMVVDPEKKYCIDNINFETVWAYNTNKSYHPKEKEYVGYNILIDGIYYYIMGDTDVTNEAKKVKTDVCFVPIGGTYTMDVFEAINYINELKPKKVMPIHYGLIVGDANLGLEFKKNIDKEIEVIYDKY